MSENKPTVVIPPDVPMQAVLDKLKAQNAELTFQLTVCNVRIDQLTEALREMGAEV